MARPILAALLALAPNFADAQVAPEPGASTQPAQPAERQSPVPAAPQQPQGLFGGDALLGDAGGVRTGLAAYGLKLGLIETDELLGNVSGGVRTGLVYEGLTTASLDLDLSRIGGTARVSALQLHGRGLSFNDVGNLQAVSSIEGTRATRLFELWYQQSFRGGKVDLKLGQQSADLEFATSAYAGLFVNSSFGWPALFAVDLPAGGPAFPLAALGARLRVKPTEPLTLMLAVFNGSPSGFGDGDPQGRQHNPSGTEFRLGDGAFVIGEVQYATQIAGATAPTSWAPGTTRTPSPTSSTPSPPAPMPPSRRLAPGGAIGASTPSPTSSSGASPAPAMAGWPPSSAWPGRWATATRSSSSSMRASPTRACSAATTTRSAWPSAASASAARPARVTRRWPPSSRTTRSAAARPCSS